ncbi:MAG: hypothetical protein IEMM0002_0136 [bacterium]|nr:MAG: hypothetical protein IEMM0002_0136 [bacterium]
MILKNPKEVIDAFNNAISVSLEFHGHQYRGEVVDIKVGEHVVFKVKNADDGLVRVPIGYDLIYLRLLTKGGKAITYRTELQKKKIPLMLLKFPEEEQPTFIRAHHRHHVNMSTPIVVTKREAGLLEGNISGIGSITDLSEGGCAVKTSLRLESNDTINLFLNLSDSSGHNSMELTGEVKRVGKPSGKIINYGIQFKNMDRWKLKELGEFIKRHPSMAASGYNDDTGSI